MEKQQEVLFMQTRLFRALQARLNITMPQCADVFEKYHLMDYIDTCYGIFHVQGDEANLDDILDYLKKKGFYG